MLGLIGAPFFFKAIMAWHRPDNALGWRFDPEVSGGGVIMDGNVHHISNALFLLGEPEVSSVYAEYATLATNSQVRGHSRRPCAHANGAVRDIWARTGCGSRADGTRQLQGQLANFWDKGHRPMGTRANGLRCGCSAVTRTSL